MTNPTPHEQVPEALRLAHIFDSPLPPEWPDMVAAAAELRRQHARIAELESQLAQRFDAADVATAAAQGFRDGAASVSVGAEPVAWLGNTTDPQPHAVTNLKYRSALQ